mmetsp:Transcript_51523/g.151920  ORF Transcript_51523/g.151920 Transcript_51523/m.151920 type:complete len:208 (-) Transcript_51523:1727-2350(-)
MAEARSPCRYAAATAPPPSPSLTRAQPSSDGVDKRVAAGHVRRVGERQPGVGAAADGRGGGRRAQHHRLSRRPQRGLTPAHDAAAEGELARHGDAVERLLGGGAGAAVRARAEPARHLALAHDPRADHRVGREARPRRVALENGRRAEAAAHSLAARGGGGVARRARPERAGAAASRPGHPGPPLRPARREPCRAARGAPPAASQGE